MNLLSRFTENNNQYRLISLDDHLLLAVSGGLDSVVLAHLCKEAGYSFSMAHCNFQLRGAESERDAVFVEQLAKALGVKLYIKKFETADYAAEKKISIQLAARELRYSWFNQLMEESTGPKITKMLTAHQADDSAETVLLNLFRGTGLRGLTGIPLQQGDIRRPLLFFTRAELRAYADARQLIWVEDSSNAKTEYTRNAIRHEILPVIRNVFPDADAVMQQNIRRLKETGKLYRMAVDKMIQQIIKKKGEEILIPVNLLLQYDNKALLYEIIRGYGFSSAQLDEVYALTDAQSGRFTESADHRYRVIRHRHWLVISPVSSPEQTILLIQPQEKTVDFPRGQLTIEKLEGPGIRPNRDQHQAWLDAGKLEYPLILRRAKTGDYFYPLGMRKKKKVARFLIDQKLSKTEKEKIWVLESGKRIVWVVGMRIDERVKIMDNTRGAVVIRLV